ncbi:MAG: hypothetical protein WCC14_21735 [Acidobacteriaceae bacterium]
MLVLYGIYVVCTMVLIGAAVAVTRHILQHRRADASQVEHHDESA